MPFTEYVSKKTVCAEANYFRISNLEIKFSRETFEEMGSPKKIKLYFDSATNRIALKGSQDMSGFIVKQTGKSTKIYSVYAKSFMKNFRLVFEKPVSCKIVREANMFTCSLYNGCKSK